MLLNRDLPIVSHQNITLNLGCDNVEGDTVSSICMEGMWIILN